MKVMIFGSTGKLGAELAAKVGTSSDTLYMPFRNEINLLMPKHVGNMIRDKSPTVVINAAAFNGMEAAAKKPDEAFIVNAAAPAAMAKACADIGALFIHYSTDYVFGRGNAKMPPEDQDQRLLTETTPRDPIGIYGWTKAAGEDAVRLCGGLYLIFRLQTLYDRNFAGPLDPVAQVARGAGTIDNPVKILHQRCAPTSARLVAEATNHAIRTDPDRWKEIVGLYHLASRVPVWRADFAMWTIAEIHGGDARHYSPITLPEPRPIHSTLDTGKFQQTFDYELPTWAEDFSLTFFQSHISG